MSCPYRTHKQFVNWLVKYKNWPRKEAQALNVHEMRKMYYSEPPIPKYASDMMDFDEACEWYQRQAAFEEANSQVYDTVEECFGDEFTNPRGE